MEVSFGKWVKYATGWVVVHLHNKNTNDMRRNLHFKWDGNTIDG
jgi:hypothetical protein